MAQSNPALPVARTREAEPHHLNKAALTMLVGTLITAIGPALYFVQTPRLDRFLATILLLLPSVLIVFGAIRLLPIRQHPELLTQGTAAFDIAKNVLVAAYVYGKTEAAASVLHALALLSLGSACVMVVLVYVLTSWIMNAHSDGSRPAAPLPMPHDGVIRQLLQHRFLSICGLLVAYLHLLLFLGLAIAFHDAAMGGMSMERQAQRTDLPVSSAGTASDRQATAGVVRTFTFPMGSTSLRCTATAGSWPFKSEFFDERNTNDWRVEQLQAAEVLAGRECAGELHETAWNIQELNGLKTELSRLYEHAPFDRYRIAVVAHATDNKPNSGFSSNYEMSRARAEQVQALVETLLAKLRDEAADRPPLNVEWQIMPSGTGNMYLSAPSSPDARRLRAAGLSRALTTEVQFTRIPDHLTKLQRESLERRNGHGAVPELQLLDYLYFMTTIGAANDLAPASSFVQFVAAAGHISQLVLLVLAFNVILAFRRPLIDGDDQPQA